MIGSLLLCSLVPPAAALSTWAHAGPAIRTIAVPSVHAPPLPHSHPLLIPSSPSRAVARHRPCTAQAAAAAAEAQPDPNVARLRSKLWSVGWFSWWAQVILSVVSGVLLLFANSVMQRPSSALLGGLVLALAGLGSAFCSVFWTWGYTRTSVRLGRQQVTPAEAAKRARGSLRSGLLLNLVGMGASLLGTYAIVGTLAAKALTQSAAVVVGATAPVQALDLLIVQANTNTLAAHFIGLCASLRLLRAASACEGA